VSAAHGAGSAAEFLSPALLELIEAVRVNARRVIASGAARRKEAPDEEAVHDFRVALRRLRTLLRPARRVYGKRRVRQLGEDLRVYADATSVLRDEEVLRETLQELKLEGELRACADAWLTRRARKERACRADVIRLLGGDKGARATPASAQEPALEPSLAQLEKRIAHPKRKRLPALALARTTVAGALAGVRALAAGDPADGAAMHALRIRFKRLRYAAETFAPLLGERASRTARSAAKMQRRLGQLHDIDEAMVRMRRAWGLSPAQRVAVLDALATARVRLVEKAAADLDRELQALSADAEPSASAEESSARAADRLGSASAGAADRLGSASAGAADRLGSPSAGAEDKENG
jgi:CHAD domain-containing protein